MHGPRCFLQELPGHVHFCMGAYSEYSSRLRNFEGFKLVTNLEETKEAKCKYNIGTTTVVSNRFFGVCVEGWGRKGMGC